MCDSCSSMLKVVKFGGSSLADAEHFLQVKSIIEAEEGRRYVVPSAPGKRYPEDEKVTDMLYECYRLADAEEDITPVFDKIRERYQQIVDGLGIEIDLDTEFATIKWAICHHAGRDYAASRGEYLSGIILSKLLGYHFLDAARIIKFTNSGTFDSEITNDLVASALGRHYHAVIPGFYGSMPNGTVKTFSRGGSDVTGSIVARACAADLYENWTDVSGFMMADPRIVKNPAAIDVITYRELRELSYMGAGVLHEDAIFPVRFAGIPINIKNTNRPEDVGTMIVAEAEDKAEAHTITGIAGKKGFSYIAIEKDMMNAEVGFGRRVLAVLEHEGICFEHLPSGIDTMCVVVATSEISDKKQKLIDTIISEVSPDTVSIEDGLALLAVVGRGMIKATGSAAKVFTALANAGINVRMIDQGSSELNIIIGIDESDYEHALNAIYDEFMK